MGKKNYGPVYIKILGIFALGVVLPAIIIRYFRFGYGAQVTTFAFVIFVILPYILTTMLKADLDEQGNITIASKDIFEYVFLHTGIFLVMYLICEALFDIKW